MAERDLVVRFIGDDRDLQQAFNRSERRAGQFDSRMTKLNQSLRGGLTGLGSRSSLLFGSGAFLSTAAITAGIQESVDAASDLEEQASKVRQVFREASPEIAQWARTTAEGLGISQRQALAAVGTFGNLFNVIGLAPERASEMSRALVQLSADLASFNNASPEDVLTALRSGLIGEAEPLRRFGVLLSEARVQQIALAETGKDNVKALTDQEKALARFTIIMRDTASAQGDFARTSDGLANQTRILQANIDDLSASIGGVLIDDFGRAARGANFLIGAMQDLGGAIGALGGEDFSEANASFDELVRRAEDFASVDFTAPQLEELVPRIVAIAEEFNRLGRSDKVVQSFRQASQAIDQALSDGVITPLEKAQLEADALGRIFLQIAPEGVLQGLGAEVRGNLEDATAAARLGVEDLGAEIRSGIEDASRQAVIAARAGGEATGNAFAEGLLAASQRIEGQLAGLSDQIVQAQIEGDTRAELELLADEERRLRRQIEIQERIIARGGRGAATAREKVRKELRPDLLSNIRRQESIRNEQVRDAERAAEAQRQIAEENRREAEAAREAARARRQAEAARRQGDQFSALGLTREGDSRAPSVNALRRRLGNLREQIKGTVLDTQQTRAQLDRIAKVLSGSFGKVGRDVRLAILGMFNDIASGFEEGDDKVGPLTKTSGLNTKRIVEGLGLSAEQAAELRGRLSSFNTAGRGLDAGQPSTSTTGGFGGAQGAILVESHTTINLEGDPIAKVVTRQQQKARRRNPTQKRGPNRGR